MEKEFLRGFVQVAADYASRGFRAVRVEGVRYEARSYFEIRFRVKGDLLQLVLPCSAVEDAIANNEIVLQLERQLVNAGAKPMYE